jgi:hypothetical protein
MKQPVAYGDEVAPDDLWETAAQELGPEKSLARISANAKFTVATVAVVSTALTALGLVSAQALVGAARTPRTLAVLSVGAAVLAILAALLYLALRVRQVNVENLAEVQRWYEREFRRTWPVMAASWLLILAVALGGAAGLLTALDAGGESAPQLTLQVAGTEGQRMVTASATVAGLRARSVVALRATAESAGTAPVLLFETRTTVDKTGQVTIAPNAAKVAAAANARYRVVLLVDGEERTSVAVP